MGTLCEKRVNPTSRCALTRAPRITRRRDGRARRGAEAFDAHEEACDVGAAARFYRCRARRPT
jgi:hypothetical protein